MNIEQSRLDYLFDKYFKKTATDIERVELASLINREENKEKILALFTNAWEKYRGDGEIISIEKAEKIFENIISTKKAHVISSHVIPISNRWQKIGVAAILLFVFAGSWYLISQKRRSDKITNSAVVKIQDVKPGSNGAVLLLGNGQQVVLDSAASGTLAQQGNSVVVKKNGVLSYRSNDSNRRTEEIIYNTIYTPRGKQYANLILSDGSKVWLDASSSVRFPVAFVGNERKVEITGQVWFDVVHNNKKPFKVIAKGKEIIDLGTQFNVNAYDDKPAMTVTLLQGSLSIQSVILKPNQQAKITVDGSVNVEKNIDADAVLAWKNGFFSFDNADIKTIMSELSRWYDVDVSYAGNIPDQKFNGEIERNLTLKQVLEGLSFTNVHFRINEKEKKLIILP